MLLTHRLGTRTHLLTLECDESLSTFAFNFNFCRYSVESQMKLLARPMYSNPPLHGAAIVAAILGRAVQADRLKTRFESAHDFSA